MLLANYHGRFEPGPLLAKRSTFYPINYVCSGIIDDENVVGYLPTLAISATCVNQAEKTRVSVSDSRTQPGYFSTVLNCVFSGKNTK